ncbi:MAG: hypothetical protein Q7V63_06845 [Gammaproteobacteria bacterium]|nr:hypothetical protein [Gammaproteobacteria bacterium]
MSQTKYDSEINKNMVDAFDKHIGVNIDVFLAEEGILTEAEAAAKKRIAAYRLQQGLKE